MHSDFDFDKVDYICLSYPAVRKDCLSCHRSYLGHHKARYCWACSSLRSVVDEQKARASKLNLTEHFTIIEWIQLCYRFDRKCLRCGKKGALGPDHVVPLCLGGKNTIDNIQPLCKSCNSSKKDRSVDYRSR